MKLSRLLAAFLLACLAGQALPGPAISAPQVNDVSPRGLQLGKATTVVVRGSGLTAPVQVLLDAPIASQSVQPGASPQEAKIEITLAPEAQPGLYPLRLVTAEGISAPVIIGVDAVPQLPFAEKIDSLPVALSGQVNGDQILTARFQGQSG